MIDHLKGLIAAPLTGFLPDGAVNLDIIPRYAQMLHKNGVSGVFVNGTTGEGLSLTTRERCDLTKRWVDAAPDGLRVIVHVGHTSQEESKAMAVHAAKTGADAIGEIGPVFFRPSNVKTLVDYCAATSAAAPALPYYYYHMPSMNQVLFPMIEFLELAATAIPGLAGIKYTHEDLEDYQRCLEFMDGKYDILFGRDQILLEGLRRGAQCAVGSTYNIMAPLYHELTKAFGAHDLENAARLQAISAQTCRIAAETGTFSSALKAVMRSIGLDLGGVRRPQVDLSPKQETQLKHALGQAGALDYLNKNQSDRKDET